MAGPLLPAGDGDPVAGQEAHHALAKRSRPRAEQAGAGVRHAGPGVPDQVALLAQGGEPGHDVGPGGVRRKALGALEAPAHDVVQGPRGIAAVAVHLLNPSRDLLVLREYAGTTPAFQERMATLRLSEAPLAATGIQEQRVVA